jgi:hypothetical protein
MFVGDIINGNIYHFELNKQRTTLVLPPGPLVDKVVNSSDALQGTIFGKGFGGITDIKVGLKDDNGIDDYLCVLTFHKTQGTIFRIVSKATNATTTD